MNKALYRTSGSGLGARFRLGVAWNTLATVGTQGSSFAANIGIAHALGQEHFGQFTMVYTTLLAVSSMAQVATGMTATKYVAEFRNGNKRRAGRVLGLCGMVTAFTGVSAVLLLVLLSNWISLHLLGTASLAPLLIISSGYVIFSVINGYQQGALAGLESYKALAILSVGHAVFHVLACTIGAFMWGVSGAIAALSASSAVRWFVFSIAMRKEARKQGIILEYGKSVWDERAILLRFAFPAALAGLSSVPAVWISSAFLVHQLHGYIEMGLYGAANNLKNIVLFVPGLMNVVGASLINNHKHDNGGHHYRLLYRANLSATFVALLIAVVTLTVFGKVFLEIFGAGYARSYPILIVLLIYAMSDGLSTAVYQIIQAEERMWVSLTAIAIPRDLALVIVAYFATRAYGGIGLAVAYAAMGTIGLGLTTVCALVIASNKQHSE